jgi:hypothetical protein
VKEEESKASKRVNLSTDTRAPTRFLKGLKVGGKREDVVRDRDGERERQRQIYQTSNSRKPIDRSKPN